MKGIVFTSLADMVEDSHGIEVWENVIKGSGAAHEGVYTAGQNYPDSELFDLVRHYAMSSMSKQMILSAPLVFIYLMC